MGVCILRFYFQTEKNSLQKVVTTGETLVSFKRRLKHISFVHLISVILHILLHLVIYYYTDRYLFLFTLILTFF